MKELLPPVYGLALLTWLAPLQLTSGEQPLQRALRIETGAHTSAISSIDVDSKGQYVVSASHDGTARLWDLRSGTLVQTFRSTSASNRALDISGAAISPDGNRIAVANLGGILLFERSTGRLIKHLALAPQISRLVFSPDGQFLAVGEYGVTIFRMSDYYQVFHDASEHFAPTLGVDFDRDGRLVTCSGKLFRLYDRQFNLIAARATTSAGLPFSIRFSPDNKSIAIGAIASKSVEIVSGSDLRPIVSLPAPSIQIPLRAGADIEWIGSQSAQAEYIGVAVSWSHDGTKLYAGCGTKIQSWTKNDPKTVREFAVAGAVTSVQAIRDGVVYSLTRPGWGTLTNEGKVKLFVGPSTVNFWKNPIQVSEDGGTIAFRFSRDPSDSMAVFDIKNRALSSAADVNAPGLSPPVTRVDDLDISDFDNAAATAKLNGKPLIASGPTRCLAIAPGEREFLVGAPTESKLYGKDGELKQRIRAPVGAEVLTANISGDGRVSVIGYSDGTIRWNRLSDGKELLAFFPNIDRSGWILFSSSGYYDCSPDGEQLIGWQVSTGTQRAANFFPASEFRDTFYRPDLISIALRSDLPPVGVRGQVGASPSPSASFAQASPTASKTPWGTPSVSFTPPALTATGLPSASAAQASPSSSVIVSGTSTIASGQTAVMVSEDPLKHLPPVIRIVTPAPSVETNVTQLTVEYVVKTPCGDPIHRIRARIDDRPAEVSDHLDITATEEKFGSMVVTVPDRDCRVSLLADTEFKTSDPLLTTISVHWTGSPAAVTKRGTLYLLAIGVRNYKSDPTLDLDYPAKDAQDVADILFQQKGLCYDDVKLKTLIDATKRQILTAFDWLRDQTTDDDFAMVFMSGHGTNDVRLDWYFLPTDFENEDLRATGLPAAEIAKIVRDTHGRAFIVFLDSCFSGNAPTGGSRFYDVNRAVMELTNPKSAGAIVFSASDAAQLSYEDPESKNGVFTRTLVEGLKGAADFMRTGEVTITGLDHYISVRVKQLTNKQQTPYTFKQSRDFAIARHHLDP